MIFGTILRLLAILIVIPSYSVGDILLNGPKTRIKWLFIILWMPYEYGIILPLSQYIENNGVH